MGSAHSPVRSLENRRYWMHGLVGAGLLALLFVALALALPGWWRGGPSSGPVHSRSVHSGSHSGRVPSEALTGKSGDRSSAATDERLLRDLKSLRRELEGSPTAASFAGPMLIAWLEARLQWSPAADEYWRPGPVREARERVRAAELAEIERMVLAAAFGAGAADDPAFASLYRSQDQRLSFLSADSREDVALLEHQVDRALAGSAALGITPGVAPTPAVADAIERRERRLAELLTPAELLEYARRYSPLARSLTQSGFYFTRTEFDAVFAVMVEASRDGMNAGTGGAGTVPATLAGGWQSPLRRFDGATLERVRAVLGDERFRRFRQLQDPRWQLVRTVVINHAPAADPEAVYAAITNSLANSQADSPAQVPAASGEGQGEDERQKLGEPPLVRFREGVQDREERDRKLVELIGPDAADILRRSLDASPLTISPRGTQPATQPGRQSGTQPGPQG